MGLPQRVGAPLTVADLDALPDDGRRYELIGGAIVMTPARSTRGAGGQRRPAT